MMIELLVNIKSVSSHFVAPFYIRSDRNCCIFYVKSINGYCAGSSVRLIKTGLAFIDIPDGVTCTVSVCDLNKPTNITYCYRRVIVFDKEIVVSVINTDYYGVNLGRNNVVIALTFRYPFYPRHNLRCRRVTRKKHKL